MKTLLKLMMTLVMFVSCSMALTHEIYAQNEKMRNSVDIHSLGAVNVIDQYMSVCTETQEHGGKEFALTAWLDSWDAANKAGKAHEKATKGHRWAIKERQKHEDLTTAKTPNAIPINTTTKLKAADCEGNACGATSVLWDENRRRHRVENRSPDKWIKVELKNWAATEQVRVRPGGTEYLLLQAYMNPYRSNYD